MGECFNCGKGIRIFEGFNYSGKVYCKDCYGKRHKLENKNVIKSKSIIQKENEQVKTTKERALFLWGVIGFIIIAFWAYFMFFDNSQEYVDCVDSCISDNTDCINNIYPLSDKYGEEYLDIFEVESCTNELESCISYCE